MPRSTKSQFYENLLLKGEDRLFLLSMSTFVGIFVIALLGLFVADLGYVFEEVIRDDPREFFRTLFSPEIRAAMYLSLWTTTLSTIIGVVFAVPIGYMLSRSRSLWSMLVDTMVDLPIILPPLVVGLSLLVFFHTSVGKWLESWTMEFVFQRSGIILCQLLVSLSLGIRAMKLTYDQFDARFEHVAMTLGCSRPSAFFRVTLPISFPGMIVAMILMWTRSLGIFGPLLVFVGAVRMRTEVLPTTIYLEQSIGHIETALAVALFMIVLTGALLVVVRFLFYYLMAAKDY